MAEHDQRFKTLLMEFLPEFMEEFVPGRVERLDFSESLDDQQQIEYEQLIRTPPYQRMIPMMTTTFEKGVQKGELQGQRRLARLLLEKRFGPLSAVARQRLDEWPVERLDELLLALLDAPSLTALGLED